VLSAPALAMLLLNLPAGKLVDSWGRKQMMVAGMLIIAFRRVLVSHWSPYDRVRVVNADP
jgi:MFS family permease